MKTLCSDGFKISLADKKAWDHYLLETPKEWAEKALKGMINKALKTIKRDYFEIYRKKQTGTFSIDLPILIPNLIALPEFKPYNTSSLEKRIAERKEVKDQEIWSGGFSIEDYEDQALKAFYDNPEQVLKDYMENKIALRKEAFIKDYLKDPARTTIPANVDDCINLVVQEVGYKPRAEKELEA